MSHLKQKLVGQLQEILHAANRLTDILPGIVESAHHPKVREALEKNLVETWAQVERLKTIFELLGVRPDPRPCADIMDLIHQEQHAVDNLPRGRATANDLALVGAVQTFTLCEIRLYSAALDSARQADELESARLLAHTLGEEENADFLLASVGASLVRQARLKTLNEHEGLYSRA